MKKIVWLFLFGMLLTSCAPSTPNSAGKVSGGYYEFYYDVIDGTPCLVSGDYEAVAISCDWGKWDGTVVNGEIVIQK